MLDLPASDEMLAIEHEEVLRYNGFEIEIDEEAPIGQRLHLVAMPISKSTKKTEFTFDGECGGSLCGASSDLALRLGGTAVFITRPHWIRYGVCIPASIPLYHLPNQPPQTAYQNSQAFCHACLPFKCYGGKGAQPAADDDGKLRLLLLRSGVRGFKSIFFL